MAKLDCNNQHTFLPKKRKKKENQHTKDHCNSLQLDTTSSSVARLASQIEKICNCMCSTARTSQPRALLLAKQKINQQTSGTETP